MADFKVELFLKFEAEVAESPAWHPEHQALYWIDMHKHSFNRLATGTGTNTEWKLPVMPGSFVFRENGALISCRDGIYDFDFTSERFEKRIDPPYDSSIYRFNDGKCDRQGRLWVGTQPLELSDLGTRKAALYRYDGNRIDQVMEIDMANGLAFTADGRTMYRAETARREIFVYDFDGETGTPSNARILAQWSRGTGGAPDGATVDTEGGYWVALPAGETGGAIGRFTPDGTLDIRIDVPVPGPSMVAFGGPEMSTLYITTAQFPQLAGRPGSELSGSFFKVETGFRGVPEPVFRG
ncbi:hypothetical protein ASE00_13595 [Sphingomonas sp. Root710]|uniref:SMP-30/gluconolactonase/LRE family protein n=1 Tax=Sphingomonas sp. Root710 TaxID=1736594 RepID=UPI0006F440C8|nr:SMP-30/gluconolactonase/LRE family protein [Sphingomonas sp. Root710]KRB83017.1 hypothetical protein ASE00_13595 [Sphingomonas sp. Root710]